MLPTGLYRALSGLFSFKDHYYSSDYLDGQNSQQLAELQSLAESLSVRVQHNVKDDSPPSLSSSSNKPENDSGSHLFAYRPVSQTLNKNEVVANTHDTQSVSSAACLASQSESHKTYRSAAMDNQALDQWLQEVSESIIDSSGIRLVLEQVKADLLQVTQERDALNQHMLRQDEENQALEIRLQDERQKSQSLQSQLEAQSAIVDEVMATNTQLKEHFESANKTNKDLQEDLNIEFRRSKRLEEDLLCAKRLLEKTKSVFGEQTTQLQELTDMRNDLGKSLWKARLHENDLKIKFQDAQSEIAALTEERDEAEEQMTKYRAFAQALYKEVQPERDQHQSTAAHIIQLESLLEWKTTALEKVEAQLVALQKEQETWQARMDTMVHKVSTSERRVRMLNHAAQAPNTREMGDDSYNHVIKRGNNRKSNKPSAEIVQAMMMLNEAIFEMAMDFMPLFLSSSSAVWSGDLNRAKVVLGEWVTSLLHKEGWSRPSVLQSIIQIFLVDWCRAIIEAWYPKQQSFAELFLTGLGAQKMLSSNDFNDVIELKTIQITESSLPDIGAWATQILDDLLQIIPAPNINSKHRRNTLLPKLAHMAQLSYEIRQALAEEDICGNLQLLIPPSDIQFQPNAMNAIGVKIQKKAPIDLGDIAGSAGIGLQSMSMQKSDNGVSFICRATILEPNVVLARDMVTKTDLAPNSAEE